MPEPALTQGVIYLTSQLCQRISISLFSSIWQTCLLTLAVALILQLVPKVPAWARFVIWAAALVVSVSLPIVAVFAAPSHSGYWSTPAIQLDPRWSFVLAGVWAAFSSVRAILLLRSAFRLHAVWKRAIPVDDPAIRSFISSRDSGRSAVLCTSKDVSQPSVIGFFAPRILDSGSDLQELSRLRISSRSSCTKWSTCAAATTGSTLYRRSAWSSSL